MFKSPFESESSLEVWVLTAFYGLCFCALHAVLHFLCSKRLNLEGVNKIISTLHAAFSISTCIWVFMNEHNACQYGILPVEHLSLTVSSGYFFYDMIVAFSRGNFDFVFHHLATAGGMMYALLNHESVFEVCMCTLLAEISTPILNFRYFFRPSPEVLQQLKHRSGAERRQVALSDDEKHREAAFQALSFAFAIVFLISRFAIAPFLLVHTLTCQRTSLYMKVGSAAIYAVSVYWAFKIVKMLYRGIADVLGRGRKVQAKAPLHSTTDESSGSKKEL